VIPGWESAFPTIAVGETCELKLSSAYGYGSAGSAGKGSGLTIPPGAALIFTIDFVGIHDDGKNTAIQERADEEATRLAELREERANATEAANNAKAAQLAAKAEAAAKLAAKAKTSGKKGKGSGGAASFNKAAEGKPSKAESKAAEKAAKIAAKQASKDAKGKKSAPSSPATSPQPEPSMDVPDENALAALDLNDGNDDDVADAWDA